MIQRVKIRGFEVAKGWEDLGVRLPEQATEHSAGYDFFAVGDAVLAPMVRDATTSPVLIPTGIKAYMRPDEVLVLANRSSNPKKGLLLANGIGVIDADYYENEDNDGHIMFAFWNLTPFSVTIKKGDKIGQGIFLNFLKADGSDTKTKRKGGFGHSGI